MFCAQTSLFVSTKEALGIGKKREDARLDYPTVLRKRRTVTQVYRELNTNYFRRAFWMPYSSFGWLYHLLVEDLKRESGTKRFETYYVKRFPNCPILLIVHQAAVILFFRGREVYCISVMFGIPHSAVLIASQSLWTLSTIIRRQRSHFPQITPSSTRLTMGSNWNLKLYSSAVGCIDGIAIWHYNLDSKANTRRLWGSGHE